MRNGNGSTRSKRQTWLTVSRIISLILLAAIVVGVYALFGRSFAPISAEQASRVQQGAAYLEFVGFSNPTYLGIQPGAEGSYPTYSVTTLNGESVEVWVRTEFEGGSRIQPVGYFGSSIGSAYELARYGNEVTYTWEHLGEKGVEPSAEGNFGEYESAQYAYDTFGRYAMDLTTDPSTIGDWTQLQTDGWPQR